MQIKWCVVCFRYNLPETACGECFLHYIEPVMAVILQFDPSGVREIMWQGMAEHRNAQDPLEEVFNDAGRWCARLFNMNRVGKEVWKGHAPTSKKIKSNGPL